MELRADLSLVIAQMQAVIDEITSQSTVWSIIMPASNVDHSIQQVCQTNHVGMQKTVTNTSNTADCIAVSGNPLSLQALQRVFASFRAIISLNWGDAIPRLLDLDVRQCSPERHSVFTMAPSPIGRGFPSLPFLAGLIAKQYSQISRLFIGGCRY
ncbi:hypothetical protein [Phaeobacter sp. C3_T13_0]|uniref:hypothetical protein n=1 Tax=Phaeobacter cretensis TaxID=3342641 RepID=UPI0039BD66FA